MFTTLKSTLKLPLNPILRMHLNGIGRVKYCIQENQIVLLHNYFGIGYINSDSKNLRIKEEKFIFMSVHLYN